MDQRGRVIRCELTTEADTLALGVRLARGLPRSAPRALCVALSGELGAGKTTLARGVLQGLGVTGPVRSPTYTLVEPYPLAQGQVLHLDLYRLEGPEGLEGLAVRDEWQAGTLLLVEWPERAGTALPPPDLHIHLAVPGHEDPGRVALIDAPTALGQEWLSRLQHSG
jgi:tRNA threonylcarbamoyladenosine biosynthesis protein TsaE